MSRSTIHDRVIAIPLFSHSGRSIVFSLLLWLAGSQVYGQQSYIPWSGSGPPLNIQADAGSRAGAFSSTARLPAVNPLTTHDIDFTLVYQDIQRTAPLPTPFSQAATCRASPPDEQPRLPPSDGLPQPTPPAAFIPNGAAATMPDGLNGAFNNGPKTLRRVRLSIAQRLLRQKGTRRGSRSQSSSRGSGAFQFAPISIHGPRWAGDWL